VKVHVRNFMAKLNVSTRGHAAAMAMKNGLVTL
jgi:DNA-binding NarL/FixJ family response regulator